MPVPFGKENFFRATMTFLKSGTLYWMKQLFLIKTNFVRICNELSLIVPGISNVNWAQKFPSNLFLNASLCWDSTLFLRDMGQNIKFGGTIGYGDWHLNYHFSISNYLDYIHCYKMLLQQCGHIMAKVQATATWLEEGQLHVFLVT